MVKVASIDLGSNSTRLLIGNVEKGKILTVLKRHEVTRMGDGIDKNGVINLDAQKRVIRVLKKYFLEIQKQNVDRVFVVGTATLRDATNQVEVVNRIEQLFDVKVNVISGIEEGYLTSLGVLNDLKLNNYLIIDIGGRSTEFVFNENNKVVSISSNIGVVSLSEKFFSNLPISNSELKSIENYIDNKLPKLENLSNREIFGVAGTFTSLGSIHLQQSQFNEDDLHHLEIDKNSIIKINEEVLNFSEAKILSSYKGIDPKRAKTITSGIFLATKIIKKYNIDVIKVSNCDILEGLILKNY